MPPRHAHDQRAQRLRNPLETSVPGPRPPSLSTPGQPVRDARPVGVASAVFERSHLLVQLLFTPLLASWSIWAGIAISARSVDVRAAQQLGTLASLPPLAIVALMSLNVITPTLGLALGLAAALLVVDVLGWRAVAAMFDRERLVTGTRT